MSLKKGERFRCPDPKCGCEIGVTKGAEPGQGGDLNPRCCCGKEMHVTGVSVHVDPITEAGEQFHGVESHVHDGLPAHAHF